MKNQNKARIKYYSSHNINSMPNQKPKRIRHTEEDNQVCEEQNTNTININDIITIFLDCLYYLFNGISVILFYRYIALGDDIKSLGIGIVCSVVASIIKILNNEDEDEDEVDE